MAESATVCFTRISNAVVQEIPCEKLLNIHASKHIHKFMKKKAMLQTVDQMGFSLETKRTDPAIFNFLNFQSMSEQHLSAIHDSCCSEGAIVEASLEEKMMFFVIGQKFVEVANSQKKLVDQAAVIIP